MKRMRFRRQGWDRSAGRRRPPFQTASIAITMSAVRGNANANDPLRADALADQVVGEAVGAPR